MSPACPQSSGGPPAGRAPQKTVGGAGRHVKKSSEVNLLVNVTGGATGTLPTLQYSLQEVDPGDELTLLGTGVGGASLTGIGTQKIPFVTRFGGALLVSWTVGGASPSFTGVYTNLVSSAFSTTLVDQTSVPIGTVANPLRTDPVGTTPQVVKPVVSTTPTRTSIPASATVVTLLNSNSSRQWATIFNKSDSGFLLIALGAGASLIDFSVEVAPGGYYELPTIPVYTGVITGLWTVASGFAQVTELAP